MCLSIHGFLVDFDKDDSLKFELDLDLAFNEELAPKSHTKKSPNQSGIFYSDEQLKRVDQSSR